MLLLTSLAQTKDPQSMGKADPEERPTQKKVGWNEKL